MPERVALFSNSTEYEDWLKANCQKCSKYRPEAEWRNCDEFVCQIDHAITQSAVFDGCVNKEIALRMGWKKSAICLEKTESKVAEPFDPSTSSGQAKLKVSPAEPCRSTAYRLPLDKVQFLAQLPTTQPDPEIFTPEVMASNLELLAEQSPEFILGFTSAVDWVAQGFTKFMEISYTADVPVEYFEKIMLTMVVAAAQKYLEELQ